MFFGLLILLVWALLAFKVPFDTFGWLMIVGFAWFAGFMDCRLYARSEQERPRVMPPDEGPTDSDSLFSA